MKNRLTALIAIVSIALVTTPLSAQITTEKDGSTFTFVYNGADLATSADWTPTPKTIEGVPYGPNGLVEGTQLRYSPDNAGTPGGWYTWNNSFTDVPGWTFEITYQVTQAETTASGPLGGIICDGTAGEYHAFYGGAGGVQAGNPAKTYGVATDFTDGMHTVRLAEESGGLGSLWIDGVLMDGGIKGLDYSYQRLLLGFLSGTQGDGEVLIDSLGVDTTGAYAPVGQIIPPPPSGNDLDGLASDSFAYKYEMDVDPTDVGAIDLDSNGIADFVGGSGGNASYTLPGDGTMEISSPDSGDYYYFHGGVNDPTRIWSNVGFPAADGITVETRVQIVSQTDTTAPYSVTVCPSDNNDLAVLDIAATSVTLGGNTIETDDNTDGFHVFRLVRDTNLHGGFYWIWRDDVLLNEEGIELDRAYVRDAIYFGDAGSGSGGTTIVDYLRFDHGAYKPEGGSVGLTGDLNGDGLVGSADLDIVRGNWGSTVTPGDVLSGDASGDGSVGSADLDIVRANWGATAAAAVPEPSVLLSLLFGIVALLSTRRR